MRVPTLLIALLLATPWTGLRAQETSGDLNLSYTFLELDYANVDLDVVDDDESILEDLDDGSGWAVRGSLAFTPHIFGFASYSITDSDATFIDENEVLLSSSQDVKQFTIGLGTNLDVGIEVFEETDVVLRAAYTDVDYDDFNFGGTDDNDLGDLNDDSSDGFFLDAGVRAQLVSWAEAALGVRYTDIESSDEFSIFGNVLFEITQNWGINLEFDAGDDIGYYLAGVRYSFRRFD